MANFSRSLWLLVVLAACGGGDGGDADSPGLEPPMCQADSVLRYVHDLGGAEVRGEFPASSYVFANKLTDDDPGVLAVDGADGDELHVEFERLIAKGDSAPATGSFKIGDLEAGNCEAALVSRIHALPGEGWTVQLIDLHAAPYCEGAAIAGSFAACFVPEPF